MQPVLLLFTNSLFLQCKSQHHSVIAVCPVSYTHLVASCGCTVPDYTKEPILPGKTGTIKVTYNGTGKYPGHFKKSITLRTNAKTEMLRLDVYKRQASNKDIQFYRYMILFQPTYSRINLLTGDSLLYKCQNFIIE